jgi:diacylglycerol kinase (ATP)
VTQPSPKGVAGIARIVNATRYSLQGLAAAIRHEAAFRQELALAAVLVPLGLWLGADGVERALLAASVLLVLVVELLNSAIEAVVDRVSPEDHDLAKRAKDYGSAAVMIALATAGLVWVMVLLPRLGALQSL